MMPVCTFSARVAKVLLSPGLAFVLAPVCWAQDQSQNSTASNPEESGTSTDLFVMLGSDFVRLGLAPKANYNIGIGHTFGTLNSAVTRRVLGL
jgi:hypothetical protein